MVSKKCSSDFPVKKVMSSGYLDVPLKILSFRADLKDR
jgi:hypothetical protein